jgi:SAM-dependent methyltransferase
MKRFGWLRRLRHPTGNGQGSSKQQFYGSSYFEGRGHRLPGRSGYGGYTRYSSNADVGAYLLWRFFDLSTSLDIGCAKGYLVEALHELGVDSYGWDVSEWAVSDAPLGVRDRVAVVDLEEGIPEARFKDTFSLVTAFEVLEHLRPEAVPAVLASLRPLCGGYLVATIPSLGTNVSGPDGFASGKVKDDRLAHYQDLGPGYDGPVPYDDLMLDDDGNPVQGHLTIASFAWWTRMFEAAGFRRLNDRELAMHPVLGRFDLSVAWNLYVFHVDSSEPRPMPLRSDLELAELEARWKLAAKPLGVHSQNLTLMTVGPEAVTLIEDEYAASQKRQTLLR